jgi:hypothetical protein
MLIVFYVECRVLTVMLKVIYAESRVFIGMLSVIAMGVIRLRVMAPFG